MIRELFFSLGMKFSLKMLDVESGSHLAAPPVEKVEPNNTRLHNLVASSLQAGVWRQNGSLEPSNSWCIRASWPGCPGAEDASDRAPETSAAVDQLMEVVVDPTEASPSADSEDSTAQKVAVLPGAPSQQGLDPSGFSLQPLHAADVTPSPRSIGQHASLVDGHKHCPRMATSTAHQSWQGLQPSDLGVAPLPATLGEVDYTPPASSPPSVHQLASELLTSSESAPQV